MNFFKQIAKKNSHSLIIKPLAGLGRSINRFYENRNHHARTNGEFTVLSKLAQLEPKLIFDVGANVGDYALMVKQTNPKATVFSFEPVESTFRELQKNVLERSLSDVITVNKGLYKENKSIIINIYPGHEHASIHDLKGVSYSKTGQKAIEVVTGDSFLEESEWDFIDLLKLDIEGAEMDALKGFEKTLEKKRIRAIQFEYGYINISSRILLCDFYDFFSAHGYILGKIYPRRVEFREYAFKHEDFIGPNFMAVHSSDQELIKLLS